MRVFLANDTTHTTHAGCMAVMDTVRELLSGQTITGIHKVGHSRIENNNAFNRAHVLVVNGEGTTHHERPASDYLMKLLQTAQAQGKKTALINAIWQHSREQGYCPHIVEKLDLFTVRDPLSQINATKVSKRKPLMFPDLCIEQADGGTPIPEFAGKVVIGDAGAAGVLNKTFANLMQRYSVLPLFKIQFKDLVATLRTARIFVTGRHHGLYAALLAGIPVACVPSNSHKIESLVQWLKLDIPVCTEEDRLLDQIRRAPNQQTKFQEAGSRLRLLPRLTRELLEGAL